MSLDDPRWGVIGVAFTLVSTITGFIIAIIGISDPLVRWIGIAVAVISIVCLIVIFLKLRKSSVEQGNIEVHFQVSESNTNLPLAGSEIYISSHGTNKLITDSNGDAKYNFPSMHIGEIYKINVRKKDYQSQTIQERIGEKVDIRFSLKPVYEQQPSIKLKQNGIQKDPLSETVGGVNPQLRLVNQTTLDFDDSPEKEMLISFKTILQEVREKLTKTDLLKISEEEIISEQDIEKCKVQLENIFEGLKDIKEKPFADIIRSSIKELFKKVKGANTEIAIIHVYIRKLSKIENNEENKEEVYGERLRVIGDSRNRCQEDLEEALIIISRLELVTHPF